MSQERVMLLIDADNLSVDVMEQAVRLLLNQHGGLHVRRAYCTAESAVANQTAFKRLGIKPMVNLAAGKNSTDIAMAVDAIDLVLSERPDVVVIASSDSDFAPLVQRLREKGCVVRGIGQKGKVGDETQDVYDDYTVIEHRGGGSARAPARTSSRTSSQAPARGAVKAASPARASRARVAGTKQALSDAPAAQEQAFDAPVPKAASSRRAGGGRAAAELAPPDPGPTHSDTSAIFEAILEGALDEGPGDEAVLAETTPAPVPDAKPTAKPRSRARKTVATAAVPAAATLDAESAAPAAPTDATEAPKPRARGRKPKVEADAAPAPAPEMPPIAAIEAAPEGVPSVAPAPRATQAAVMACLPELARGQALALNVAVQRLREARLLGKNSSSLKLFSQLSDSFELLPARNPSQVRLRR